MKIGRGEFLPGDCFERMASIPDGSVDMILCDLPYGTTACKWDSVIPFEPLWKEYWRVAKPGAAVVLTASQPFTSALVMSQVDAFRHSWVWNKKAAANVLNAKHGPLKVHEDVLVFSARAGSYRPQMTTGKMRRKGGTSRSDGVYAGAIPSESYMSDQYHPKSIVEVSGANQVGKLHPTQKPVALFEYLIRTYTDDGMTVLDNCAGSGTTAIAAENANRNWICIERDPDYYAKATERVVKHVEGLRAA